MDPSTTGDLFVGLGVLLDSMSLLQQNGSSSPEYRKLQAIAALLLQCLAEFANVRITIFDDKQAKIGYVGTFVTQLIQFLRGDDQGIRMAMVRSSPKIFRELVKVIHKFHNNFGLRNLDACNQENLVQCYFQVMYSFTLGSLQSQQPNKKQILDLVMGYLNQVWQRFIFETVQLKLEH